MYNQTQLLTSGQPEIGNYCAYPSMLRNAEPFLHSWIRLADLRRASGHPGISSSDGAIHCVYVRNGG
jgi:hypothetical protein